ncbi:hypothetical protein ACIPSJ_04185 [Streptomyces sp. NPDC090088]|uniref:hypothetical protein n=1 Tax=Streptomyces sp. NPDC090088 TaxID=3365944 RepID=UPI0037F8EAA0
MSQDGPPEDWEPHERRLWEAYRHGEWCADVPEVRAEALRWLLVAAPRPVPGRLARLRLRGARITGALDLAEAAVQGAIRLESCRFDEPPCFDGGQFGVLQLKDCALPGLSAVGARVGQECEIVGCALDGTLNLRSLSVGTHLLLDGSTVTAPEGRAAVDAQSLAVQEHLSATGLVCTGPIRLKSSRVQDTLGLRGARIQGGRAGLQAPELTVGGGLYLDRGFSSDGTINLYGASIGGSLHLEDATLTGADARGGEPALQLLCASVDGDIQAGAGLTVRGSVDMRDTSVRGSVVLGRARLDHPAGTALKAHRLHVGGDLDCRDGFVARGTVDLCDARIGGSVLLEGAELTGLAGAAALRANGIEVGAEFNCCDGLTAHGRISLSSITVRARLCFENALLDVPAGERALICRRSAAAELTLKPRQAPDGIVDLSHTRIGVLRDDAATWPRALVLEGLAYDSTKPALPGRRRLTWLDRDPAGFAPQPYEQLAANYQRHGRDADARVVLLAKQRRRRTTLAWPARVWSLLQDLTVGYGYRPLRAVLLLAVFFTVGTALFATWPPVPDGDGVPPDFQPAVYTLDLLLPVVDFGQERAFAAHGAMQWAVVVLVSAGWILATTAAAGANRVLRRS